MNKILVGFLSMSLMLMFSLVSTDMNSVEAASKHASSKSHSKKHAKRKHRSKRKSRHKKKRRGGGCQTLSSATLRQKASPYRKSIRSASKKYGVNKSLIQAVITIESCFRSKARGALGEKGLMQLMPKTARRLKVKDGYNSRQNIHGGAKYLGFLLNRYHGNMTKAIAAYNAGEGRIDKGRIPNMRYVRKVLHAYRKFSGGKAAKTVKVPKNSLLKSSSKKRKDKLRSEREKSPAKRHSSKKASSRHAYIVKQGDTVYEVMRQTGMPVKTIIRMNHLKRPYGLKVGQQLRIEKSSLKKTSARKSTSVAKEYVVQTGDTVYNVMRQTGVPVKTIIRLNHLSLPYNILLGQKLRLR